MSTTDDALAKRLTALRRKLSEEDNLRKKEAAATAARRTREEARKNRPIRSPAEVLGDLGLLNLKQKSGAGTVVSGYAGWGVDNESNNNRSSSSNSSNRRNGKNKNAGNGEDVNSEKIGGLVIRENRTGKEGHAHGKCLSDYGSADCGSNFEGQGENESILDWSCDECRPDNSGGEESKLHSHDKWNTYTGAQISERERQIKNEQKGITQDNLVDINTLDPDDLNVTDLMLELLALDVPNSSDDNEGGATRGSGEAAKKLNLNWWEDLDMHLDLDTIASTSVNATGIAPDWIIAADELNQLSEQEEKEIEKFLGEASFPTGLQPPEDVAKNRDSTIDLVSCFKYEDHGSGNDIGEIYRCETNQAVDFQMSVLQDEGGKQQMHLNDKIGGVNEEDSPELIIERIRDEIAMESELHIEEAEEDNEIEQKEKKEVSQDANDDTDDEDEELFQRLRALSPLADLPSVPSTIPSKPNVLKHIDPPTQEELGDSEHWCIICLEPATYKCSGCDGDLYCGPCLFQGHTGPNASIELKKHKWTMYTRPRQRKTLVGA